MAAAHGWLKRIRQYALPSNTLFLGPSESTTQRHLDRFSHFSRAHDRDRPTDRPTDRQTYKQTDRIRYYICNNSPHLHSTV